MDLINTHCVIGMRRLWTLLQELPTYAMATVVWNGRTYELMARDLPGNGRRMTCITTGVEWFIDDKMFKVMNDGTLTAYSISYGGKIR